MKNGNFFYHKRMKGLLFKKILNRNFTVSKKNFINNLNLVSVPGNFVVKNFKSLQISFTSTINKSLLNVCESFLVSLIL